jgi:threonine aldolase
MRDAMAKAKVGDDVYADDPTVKILEYEIAKLFGKSEALLVPSGTMSNLIGMMINAREKGEGAIVGHLSHVYNIERGGMSALASIHPIVVRNQPDGTMNLSDIEEAIPPNNIHLSQPRVISFESSHNLCSGRALKLDYLAKVKALADKHKLRLHLDAARGLNAAVYLKTDPAVMVKPFNTVNFCLSKGMGCPVGSLIIGSQEDINLARIYRKMLGGQMR